MRCQRRRSAIRGRTLTRSPHFQYRITPNHLGWKHFHSDSNSKLQDFRKREGLGCPTHRGLGDNGPSPALLNRSPISSSRRSTQACEVIGGVGQYRPGIWQEILDPI
jgi:hypothetical protein